MLHITNGDSTAISLREAGLPGSVAVWAEPLHEGPILIGLSPPEWRQTRARFYESAYHGAYDDHLATLSRWDAEFDTWPDHEEVVIWVEHDLFDQLLLIRHLARFAERPKGKTRISLICVDRFPGITRFFGLGMLSPDDLASLWDLRPEIREPHLSLGQAAWRAFGSPDAPDCQREVSGHAHFALLGSRPAPLAAGVSLDA